MKKLLWLIPVLLLVGCGPDPLGHRYRITSANGMQWEVCGVRDRLMFGYGSVGFDTAAGRVVLFGATVEQRGECGEGD